MLRFENAGFVSFRFSVAVTENCNQTVWLSKFSEEDLKVIQYQSVFYASGIGKMIDILVPLSFSDEISIEPFNSSTRILHK